MRTYINDGYTRHVEIGDNLTMQRVEFKYRRPRGSALHRINERMSDADYALKLWHKLPTVQRVKDQPESAADIVNQLLIDHLEWWDYDEFEGCPNCEKHEPTIEALESLDAKAYVALVNVVVNGFAPDVVFDRPEQNGQPLPAAEQEALDAGN